MKVQVYNDGMCGARAFVSASPVMVAELSGPRRSDAERDMRALGWRRAEPWKRVSWGFEARFRPVHAQD